MFRSQDIQLNSSQNRTDDMLQKNLSMPLVPEQNSTESKVGKILSESTQKAVITLVLSMLLSAAILDL